MAVGTEYAAEKFAHHGHWTFVVEHEGRQARRLINAPADADAGQFDDRASQLHWQGDRPLALVVARAGRALVRQQLDIVEHSLSVERLTDVHAALAEDTDGAVAHQMSDEARKRQRASALVRAIHGEHEIARRERISSLIIADIVERGL